MGLIEELKKWHDDNINIISIPRRVRAARLASYQIAIGLAQKTKLEILDRIGVEVCGEMMGIKKIRDIISEEFEGKNE